MKIGNHIRDKKHVKETNKRKVDKLKHAKGDEQMALPITTKQIDGTMLMEPDASTQRSSTAAFYSDHKGEARSFMKRGRSQQMHTAPISQGSQSIVG